jgi:Flp pilus assembly CpaE family ATPase
LSAASADLVIIAINGTESHEAIKYAAIQKGLPVYAVGPASASESIMTAIRLGARAYLDQDRLNEDLKNAVSHLARTEAAHTFGGKRFVILGATPGSGASTLAVNLAVGLGMGRPDPVAVIEWSSDSPSLAVSLDVEPATDALELAQQWWRLDNAVLTQSASTKHPGLALLARRPDESFHSPLEAEALRNAMEAVRQCYSLSVIDLGSRISDGGIEAIRQADVALITFRLDVPSVRAARIIREKLDHADVVPGHVRFIPNRVGQPGQLAMSTARRTIERDFYDVLPDAPGPINKAINDGKPVASRHASSNYAASVIRLAHRLRKEVL